MPETADVLVIGGGMAGLTAAGVLARRGAAVRLLEKEDKPGGYVTGFDTKGFYFDATGAFVASCRPGGAFFDILEELGLEKELEFLPITTIRNIYADFELELDYTGPEGYVRSVRSLFPGSNRALERYAKLTARMGRELLQFEKAPLWKKCLLPVSFPTLFRHVRKTHAQILDSLFRDSRVKTALSSLPTSLPPSELSYAFVAILWAKVLGDGVFYPRGGMRTLSEALARSVQTHGGRIDLGREVVGMAAKSKRITSVRLEDGEEIRAKTIVCATSPFACRSWLPQPGLLRTGRFYLEGYKVSGSALLFYAGMPASSLPANWPYFISLHTGADLEQEAMDVEDGSLESMHIVLSTPSVLDPSLAPEGCHGVKLLVHAPGAGLFARKFGTGERFTILKERIFRVVRERTGLDLGQAFFVKKATPTTLEERTGNFEGAMYGFDAARGQVGPWRPPLTTKFENLLQCGHYARPAHGIVGSALSGLFAANILTSGRRA